MTFKIEYENDFTVRNDDVANICPKKLEYDITIKEESMDYEAGSSQVRKHSYNYLFIFLLRI